MSEASRHTPGRAGQPADTPQDERCGKSKLSVKHTAGLQGCHAMRSRLRVSSSVLAPKRAAASAASQPAWPAPTTTTSYASSWSQLLSDGDGAAPLAAAAAAGAPLLTAAGAAGGASSGPEAAACCEEGGEKSSVAWPLQPMLPAPCAAAAAVWRRQAAAAHPSHSPVLRSFAVPYAAAAL